MKNREVYHLSLNAAELFKRSATSTEEQEFWTGYLLGLKNWKHGVMFETDQEHATFIAQDNNEEDKKMIAHGYRIGIEGAHFHQAIQQLAMIF